MQAKHPIILLGGEMCEEKSRSYNSLQRILKWGFHVCKEYKQIQGKKKKKPMVTEINKFIVLINLAG